MIKWHSRLVYNWHWVIIVTLIINYIARILQNSLNSTFIILEAIGDLLCYSWRQSIKQKLSGEFWPQQFFCPKFALVHIMSSTLFFLCIFNNKTSLKRLDCDLTVFRSVFILPFLWRVFAVWCISSIILLNASCKSLDAGGRNSTFT